MLPQLNKEFSFGQLHKCETLFTLTCEQVQPNDFVGILGSCPELGSWQKSKVILLSPEKYPIWKLKINLPCQKFEYKYIILKPGDEFIWET